MTPRARTSGRAIGMLLLAAVACSDPTTAPLLTVTPVAMDGGDGVTTVGAVRTERFIAFGGALPDGRLSPALEYYTVPRATVRACSIGTVVRILPQSPAAGARDAPGAPDAAADFELHVEPGPTSPWLVIYDHVREVRVKQGQRVQAGDPLGEVGWFSERLGRVELQVNDARDGMAHCPLQLGSPEFVARHEALLLAVRRQQPDLTTLCLRPKVKP